MYISGTVSQKERDAQNKKALEKATGNGQKNIDSNLQSAETSRRVSQQNANTQAKQVEEMSRSNKAKEKLALEELNFEKAKHEEAKKAQQSQLNAIAALANVLGKNQDNVKGVPERLNTEGGTHKARQELKKIQETGGQYKNGNFVQGTGPFSWLNTGKDWGDSWGIGKLFTELTTAFTDKGKQMQLANRVEGILDGKYDDKYPELKEINHWINQQSDEVQKQIFARLGPALIETADTPWYREDFSIKDAEGDYIDSEELAALQLYKNVIEQYRDNVARNNLIDATFNTKIEIPEYLRYR